MKSITSLEYNTLIWFLIRASFIELTSSILISKALQDAWISVIIGILIGLIPFSIYTYLKYKFPNENIVSLNTKILGKFGIFLNIITIAGIFIFSTCSFWTLIHFIDSQFLYKTSTSIIIMVFIIPIAYALTKQFHIFSKVSLIMFYVVIIFIIIILFGLFSNINIENLKPILYNKPNNIIYASFFFTGFNILPLFLLTIIPNNKIKNNTIKKNTLFYFLTTLSLLNVIFLTISIFGIELTQLYDYPSFHLLKRVSVLDIIDRVESILSLEWVLAMFIQIVMSLYFIKISIKQTFKTKEKTNNYIILIICLIIAFLTNNIFITSGTENAYFQNILIYLIYLICFIIPSITFFKSLKKA